MSFLFKSQEPAQQAQAAKNRGNKFFKAGRFDKAIECYTEAIRVCPPEKVEDLSTFYQNRAAAYEQLVGIHFECHFYGLTGHFIYQNWHYFVSVLVLAGYTSKSGSSKTTPRDHP